VDEFEVKWNISLLEGLHLGDIIVSELDQGRDVWKSGVRLVGSVIEELLRLLGVNDGGFTVSTFLVGVWGSGGGGGDESWHWWHWWESNSGSLPGDWVLGLELEEGGSVWKSGVSFIGSVVEELLGLLGINDGGLSIGTLLVEVSRSTSGGGNESWSWWDWWEFDTSTLPGNWILKLDESRSVWKSGIGFVGSVIKELLGLLSIDDGGFTVSTFFVKVCSGTSGGGNESWDWWNWWEFDSSTLPGNWILELNVVGSNEFLWADSFNGLVHDFSITKSFSELVSVLSEFVCLLTSWAVNGNVIAHALSNCVTPFDEFLVVEESDTLVLLSELVSLLTSWTIDGDVGSHALSDAVALSELLGIKESDSDVFVVSWVVMVVVLLKGNGL
jgi:hypothetical protein